jgi:hypothetical protein
MLELVHANNLPAPTRCLEESKEEAAACSDVDSFSVDRLYRRIGKLTHRQPCPRCSRQQKLFDQAV